MDMGVHFHDQVCSSLPFHYSNPGLVVEDSFLLQRNTLDSLNMQRINNLKNKKISKEVFPFRQGNFVLLKLDIATEDGSKANIAPNFGTYIKSRNSTRMALV